ncbi:Eco47II family restriction endonuclease, partial [Vibrio cholerae]
MINSKYGLSFISDDDILNHVKETVNKYRFEINLKDFNNNLIDPVKLTFDAKVYGKSIEEIIESEAIRQIDKSNTNHIGYFHQNI